MQLKAAKTPADSVKILYHLFDVVPRNAKPSYGEMILKTARRAHDYTALNDMLRQLTVLHMNNDSLQAIYEQQAAKLPNSIDSKVTLIFIRNQRLAVAAVKMPEEKRKQLVASLIAQLQSKPADDYERIDRLYNIVVILGQSTQGQIYLEALERLGKLIEKLPQEGDPLRAQYYTALANIFTNVDRHADAIAADRKLLDYIDRLEKQYKKMGRIHRNYNDMRFLCYRRMLDNYQGLSTGEASDLYQRIQVLCETDTFVAGNERRAPRATAYYYMATKQYDKAIPLLQQLLNNPKTKLNQRRDMLKELRKAATATGNKDVLLKALIEYTDIIERFDSIRTADNMAELSIRHQTSRLREENARLENQTIEEAENHQRQMQSLYIAVIAVLVIAFAIVLFPLLRQKRRYMQLQQNLSANPSSTNSDNNQSK